MSVPVNVPVNVHVFAMDVLFAQAACVRELQHETRQLNVSLSAREGDVLASDREMEALSKRMKGELLEKEVAVVKAEAEAKELRQALQVATANPSDESKSGVDGASTADGNYARYRFEYTRVIWIFCALSVTGENSARTTC